MKKLLCILFTVLILYAVYPPALAASLPSQATKAILEAGFEGYKPVTVRTQGNAPPRLVFALMRKEDQNLLFALEYDSAEEAYRLLAANQNILPPGKISPKLRYVDDVSEFTVEYSLKKPGPGQPSKVYLTFAGDGVFYLQCGELTYPVTQDGLFPTSVLTSNDNKLYITHFMADRRGNPIGTKKSSYVARADWVYDLPSFSLEQAISDIAYFLENDKIPPPPLLAPIPAALRAGAEAGELIQVGDRFLEVDAKSVKLEVMGLTDLTPLARLKELESLSLAANQIMDLEPLARLSNLRELTLNRNPIEDLGPLTGLPQLKILWLDDTGVKDLRPLMDCIALEELYASGIRVTDLSPLAGLKKLKELGVADCGLTDPDLELLAGLANLEVMNISDNDIKDLRPLAGLANLQSLNISNTQTQDLEPLRALTGLKYLYLMGNPITDLSPLHDLTKLTRLDLDPSTDAKQLKELERRLKNCKIFSNAK